MNTTQTSSTPITAEGAVSVLRNQAIDAMDSYAQVLAEAATERAAIQQAGEAVAYIVDYADIGEGKGRSCFYEEGAKQHMESAVSYSENVRNRPCVVTPLAPLRAPQDAKAEQVEKCRLRLCCRADSHATGCNTYDPNRYPETRTPNGSIGEDAEFSRRLDNWIDARVDHDHDRITSSWIMLCEYLDTSTARQSAPIEAGELPLDFTKPLETEQGKSVAYVTCDVIEIDCARVCVDQQTGIVYSSPYRGLKIRNVATKPASTVPVQGKASDAEDRYEFVRKLHPVDFATLYSRNLAGEGPFDDLVDAARAQQQGEIK